MNDQMTTARTLAPVLHEALRAVSSAAPEAIQVLGHDPSESVPRLPDSEDGLYGQGLHRHPRFEMCVALQGNCRLWMRDGFSDLSPGRVVAIPPETVHAEGWASPRAEYRLLWLAVSGNAVEGFADTYHPGVGWTMDGSVAIARAAGSAVWEALSELRGEHESKSTCSRFLLKGSLLTLLSRLSRQAQDPQWGRLPEDPAEAVCRYLDVHFAEPLSVNAVADRFGRSANSLNRIFSRRMGMGIHAYQVKRRLMEADRMLCSENLPVKEAALSVGFSDPLYFCRLYRQHFGCAPSTRRGCLAVPSQALAKPPLQEPARHSLALQGWE